MLFIDISGERFGNLTAVKVSHKKGKRIYWECVCKCGNTTFVDGGNLRSGRIRSCGCLQGATHALSNSTLYRRYYTMCSRCSENDLKHKLRYFDRGIKVCEEWQGENGFLNFYNWALANGFKEGLTIDRIDNNKGYSPENCRWIPQKEQYKNMSRVKLVEYKGEKVTLGNLSELTGIKKETLVARYKKGKRGEELIKTPNKERKK